MVREGFDLKTIDPVTVTLSDSLEAASLTLEAFENDPNLQYGAGRYGWAHTKSLANLRQSIKDPAVRLRKYVDAANKVQLYHYARARDFYSGLVSPKTLAFNLYKGDELVGSAIWFLNVIAHPHADTWYQWLRRKLINLRKWFASAWNFGFDPKNHPLNNPGRVGLFANVAKEIEVERKKYPDDEQKLLELVKQDQLLFYPSDKHPSYAYLAFLVLSPKFQRQGLGSMLYNDSAELVRQSIVAAQPDAVLPPRAFLWASPMGEPLYNALRFQTTHSYDSKEPATGFEIHFPRMEKTIKSSS